MRAQVSAYIKPFFSGKNFTNKKPTVLVGCFLSSKLRQIFHYAVEYSLRNPFTVSVLQKKPFVHP